MHVAGLNMVAHPPEAAIIAEAFRMHITPKLTYYSTAISRNGNPQRVAISLPYISSIADLPRYTAPPPLSEPEPPVPKSLRAPRWSEKVIRRMLGRDRKQTARLLNRVGYEATVKRIEREGA